MRYYDQNVNKMNRLNQNIQPEGYMATYMYMVT